MLISSQSRICAVAASFYEPNGLAFWVGSCCARSRQSEEARTDAHTGQRANLGRETLAHQNSSVLLPASGAFEAAPEEPAYRFLRARIAYATHLFPWVVGDCDAGLEGESRAHSYYANSLGVLAAAACWRLGQKDAARLYLANVEEGAVVRVAGEVLEAQELQSKLREGPRWTP